RAQLVSEVDVRRGDEDMQLTAPRGGEGFGCGGHVGRYATGQRGDRRGVFGLADLRGDPPHGGRFAGRGSGESRLDDVDAKPGQLTSDLDLLLDRERGAGRLLAVAEGRVEDADAPAPRCAHRRDPSRVEAAATGTPSGAADSAESSP